MPRVYVVNEPLRKDPDTGTFGRSLNLSPAREHGELTFLLPAGRIANDVRAVVRSLRDGLKDFTPKDFLLLVGDLRAIAWASAIAADIADGKINILQWDSRRSRYDIVPAELWAEEHHAPGEPGVLNYSKDRV